MVTGGRISCVSAWKTAGMARGGLCSFRLEHLYLFTSTKKRADAIGLERLDAGRRSEIFVAKVLERGSETDVEFLLQGIRNQW